MRAAHYAKALHELSVSSKHEEGQILKYFVKTVIENGHAHLFPKIVKAFERLITKDTKRSTIRITSATAMTEEKILELLRKEPFKHALSPKHKHVERRMDDSIVGGVVVESGTTLIDASYKRMLLDLYQSLIGM